MFDTIAILAQGTHWAVAVMQALFFYRWPKYFHLCLWCTHFVLNPRTGKDGADLTHFVSIIIDDRWWRSSMIPMINDVLIDDVGRWQGWRSKVMNIDDIDDRWCWLLTMLIMYADDDWWWYRSMLSMIEFDDNLWHWWLMIMVIVESEDRWHLDRWRSSMVLSIDHHAENRWWCWWW